VSKIGVEANGFL